MGRKLCGNGGGHHRESPSSSAGGTPIKDGRAPGTYPVSLAVQFVAMGLSTQEKLDTGTLDEVLTVHQYGVAMTILNASMRIMRISHIDMQRVLYSLTRDFDAHVPHRHADSTGTDVQLRSHDRHPRRQPRQGARASVHGLIRPSVPESSSTSFLKRNTQ